jgi:hypothetical protein
MYKSIDVETQSTCKLPTNMAVAEVVVVVVGNGFGLIEASWFVEG